MVAVGWLAGCPWLQFGSILVVLRDLWSLWVPNPLILEAWRVHFGTLGDHLGGPGVPGDTPQDTLGSRSGFLSIFGGFWDPLGTHFGVILVTFS